MMKTSTAGRDVTHEAMNFAGHFLAVVAGAVLMVAGLGMGVSLVLLPIGLPVGLFGLCVFLYGLFGWSAGKEDVAPPAPR